MSITLDRPGNRALRHGRCSQSGQIYHVTTTTWRRRRLFTDRASARAVIAALRYESDAGRCNTLAFVVMPDHLHWLVQLRGGHKLSGTVNNVKAHSARMVNRLRKHDGRVWQRGFYDRALRSDENVGQVARYIIANPIRAGIAARVADYPFWGATGLDQAP